MDPELAQVERHERPVVVHPHAEGSARVEHEQGGTVLGRADRGPRRTSGAAALFMGALAPAQ